MSRHGGLTAWLAWSRAIAAWHRFETTGLEHLDGPHSKLIVGYHGRGIATDLLALNHVLYERHGRVPLSFVHAYFDRDPLLRWMKEGIGALTSEGPGLGEAVATGRHVILLPGGNREANRSFRVRYRVDWGNRTGYLRLALKHGLPVVPVAADGVDDTYIGLNDGYALGQRVKMPSKLPMWAHFGLFGPMPISPAFPVKVRQRIGAPIDLTADGPVDPNDREALLRLHRTVTATVQSMLDGLRAERPRGLRRFLPSRG